MSPVQAAFEQGDDIFTDPRELFKDMFGGEKFKEFFGDVNLGKRDDGKQIAPFLKTSM